MLTNNEILKKLRIALSLKEDDIMEILALAHFTFSKAELSALFRDPSDRRFRDCGDQFLERFLDGLILKMRGPKTE